MCPISAPAPVAPLNTRPPITIPLPIPVPRVSITTSEAPRAAPARCSARTARFAPGPPPLPGRPVWVVRHGPAPRPRPGRPSNPAPADHDPAADPGAESQHHDVGGSSRRARPLLGEDGEVRVVVDVDGEPDALGHGIPEGKALERQMHARFGHARLEI